MTQPHTPQPESPNPRTKSPLGELLVKALDLVSRLVKAEISALRAEITAKAKANGIAVGLFAVAGVLGIYLLGLLLGAAVAGFSNAAPVWLAFLIVSGIVLLIMAVLGLAGKRLMDKNKGIAPTESLAALKEDVAALKEELSND